MPPINPPASEKQTFISFARGLSMLTIVVYHFVQYVPLPPLLARANLIGGAGIYIFLFASSYGLYFSKITTWSSFYWKRFKKVLLPYYIGLTLIVVLNQFVGVYPDGWPAYLSHLLLYKMFYESYTQSFGPHFWFVSTIVQFYLLWPLLLALARRLTTGELLAFAFAVTLLHSGLILELQVEQKRIWYSSVVQYFWLLALGLVAAREQWFPRLLQLGALRYGLLMGVGLGATLLLSYLTGARGNIFNDYFMFLAYFSGAVLLFLLGQQIPVLIRFMLWLESFSYSLYIIHYFVFLLYFKALSKTQLSLYEVPVVAALCIGVALLFDKIVNQLVSLNFGRSQPALGR